MELLLIKINYSAQQIHVSKQPHVYNVCTVMIHKHTIPLSYSKYLILYVDETGFHWPGDVCVHMCMRTRVYLCV